MLDKFDLSQETPISHESQEAIRNKVNNHPRPEWDDLKFVSTKPALLNLSGLELTYNGRGALYRVFQGLAKSKSSTILLPAFHCPTIIDPVLASGHAVRYYRIESDFTIDVDDFAGKLDGNTAAALIVNFFGIPAPIQRIKQLCADAAIPLIEDCAHSFLAANPLRLCGERTDAAIFSFRKTVPCVVGGGIRHNTELVNAQKRNHKPPISDTLRKIKDIADSIALNNSPNLMKSTYLWLDRLRKRRYPLSNFGFGQTTSARQTTFEYQFDSKLMSAIMPGYARRLLYSADFARTANVRRRNFQQYARLLSEFGELLTPIKYLPDSAVPWSFPILIDNRSDLDYRFSDSGVPLFTFGETLHPTFRSLRFEEPDLYKHTLKLSNQVLCLSLHSPISADKIAAYSECMRQILKQRMHHGKN